MEVDQVENAELLQKLPSDRISSFVHSILDVLCGHAPPRYQNYASVWSLEAWWQVMEFYKSFTKNVIRYNCSREEATKALGSLPGNLKQPVLDALYARWDEMKEALVQSTNGISHAQLTDFDWQMKLAMSSDKISSVQEPLLQVDLAVREENASRTVSVELGKEDLGKMIGSLEAANKVVMQLKS